MSLREIQVDVEKWLNDIFGTPTPMSCFKRKLTEMPADIDDIYHCLLEYPNNLVANMTVEVISRPQSTRELRVIGSEGVLVMSSDFECVRYKQLGDKNWIEYKIGGGTVEEQYINPEEPYIEEMRDFLSAISNNDQKRFPNTLLDDYSVLSILYELERISIGDLK